MNAMLWWRLVWKEHCLLRGFWVAAAALCAMSLAILAWQGNDIGSLTNPYYVAMAIMAFYALGCGAVSFAGESEARTDGWQRMLPVSWRQLLWGKTSYAALTTGLLGIAVGLMAWLAVSWAPAGPFKTAGMAAGAEPFWLGGLAAIQLFAWGVFFSLRSSSPLRVVLYAFVANAMANYPIAWIWGDVPEMGRTAFYFPPFLGDASSSLPRALVTIAVLALGVHRARQWARAGTVPVGTSGARSKGRSDVTISRGPHFATCPRVSRLIWQQWRMSWRLLSILFCVFGLFVMMAIQVTPALGGGFEQGWLAVVMLGFATVWGATVFHVDHQRGQIRFLAEHGASPAKVWISRQVFGLFWLAVCGLSATAVEFTYRAVDTYLDRWSIATAAWLLAWSFIAYCAGQFMSVWIQRPIVRTSMALLLSVVLLAWSGAMYFLGVPLIWSVAPVPLVLLLASWGSLDNWMRGRSARRGRLECLALLTIPSATIFIGFAAYRWTEIPIVAPQAALSPSNWEPAMSQAFQRGSAFVEASPALRQCTVIYGTESVSDFFAPVDHRDYLAAVAAMKPESIMVQKDGQFHEIDLNELPLPTDVEALLKNRSEVLDQTMPPPSGDYLDFTPDVARRYTLLAAEYVRTGLAKQKAGDLEGALNHYIAALRWTSIETSENLYWQLTDVQFIAAMCLRYWASEPGQTPERIHQAIASLQSIHPVRSDRHRRQSIGRGLFLPSGELDEGYFVGRITVDKSYAFYKWIYRIFPWERERAIRLENVLLSSRANAYHQFARDVDEDQSLRPEALENPRIYRWITTSLMPYPHNTVGIPQDSLTTMAARSSLRTTRLILALQGWRLEHGSLPRTLEELVPGWLPEIPHDPLTGIAFRYEPTGNAGNVTCFDAAFMSLSNQVFPLLSAFELPANRPTLIATRFSANKREDYENMRMTSTLDWYIPIPEPAP